jgi:hypothetical protein
MTTLAKMGSSAAEVLYLYGIVPAGTDLKRAPAGVDDRPVEQITDGTHSALLTRLGAGEYSAAKIESLGGNIDWVRSRAEAHDRVLNWASDFTRVIPLPMWTMFRDADSVAAMLAERSAEFQASLARVAGAREYTVRAYVRSADLQTRLAEHSPEVSELEQRANSATPGQRYLLQRKLEEQKKDSARQVIRNVAIEVHEGLSAEADASVREQVAASAAASERGHAILNASYLIRTTALPKFQLALTQFVKRYEPSGFTFEFTGPWPPYHFVGAQQASGS